MRQTNLPTSKYTKQLAQWKQQDEELRLKRAELMYRLREAGFTNQKIADIYGCTRQYVTQILNENQAQEAVMA